MKIIARLLAIATTLLLHGSARADNLTTLLQGVADAGRLKTPLRAAATAEIDGVQGKSQDRLIVIERSAADATAPRQMFVQLEKAGVRLLALAPSELYVATAGKPKKCRTSRLQRLD